MAEPICEDDGILQEWAPENRLLQQIPPKIQRGIFSHNLNLTCVDVVSEYIALGTNCGFIYWYCRATNDLQRLRLESSSSTVTCVKIVSTVDYMLAAGTDRGNITVFQIPKTLPDSTPKNLKPKKNQVERFTINGLHNASVTNIEWSQNGMKLFSGDKSGLVVLTEIDFYMHLSKSMELLNEQFEIVQLSYNQQILLVSTTFRSIICDGLDNWKVHQVGTKERKILGKFGATFCKFDCGLIIYASRPGHRLWAANTNGSVQQTLLFKSVIPSSYPKIQLINPISKTGNFDTSFGKLLQFGSNKLIAYNSEIMYVLHPGAITVATCLDSARRIIDLSVNEDEIFILEGERSLLRIGYGPDKYTKESSPEESCRRRSFIFEDLASKLKDTAVESFKKITSELVATHEEPPGSPPVLADEALDLPPVMNLPAGSIPAIIPEENVQIYFSVDVAENQIFEISQQKNTGTSDIANAKYQGDVAKGMECPEVLSRPLRRRNPRRSKIHTSVQGGQESESDTTSNASEDRLVWGIANELSLSEESGVSFSQSHSSFSILRDIPTLLTANTSKTVKSESLLDEGSNNYDDKSQVSLDTCESVSEHLRLTPERFSEEQEKTFFRLANQEITLLDSYNSEKTDNMSISLNMTPSSSASSKISDNVQSNSEISESVSMVSDTKTENSPTSNNVQNDLLPLPKHLCFYTPYNNPQGSLSSPGDKRTVVSPSTSVSSENSQKLLEFDEVACPSELFSFDVQEINKSEVNRKKNFFSGESHCDSIVPANRVEIYTEEVQEASDSEGFEKSLFTEAEESEAPYADEPFVQSFADFLESEGNEDRTTLEHEEVNHDECSAVEPLNYGISRGNSAMTSGASSDDIFSVNCVPEINAEQSDHWLQYLAPGPVVCLAVASNYIVCIDTKEQVYFSGLSGLSLSWNPLTYRASWISLSNNANIVWILNKKSLFSLVNPAKKGPFSDYMLEQYSKVKFFALDNENPEGWIVQIDGQVKCQRNLLGTPIGKPEHVSCDWLLTSIACWNGVALAITSEDSVVCKPPNEDRFRSIITPKPAISCIELGPGNLAWIVDDRNNIYFSDDFLNEGPHWWQVLISDYLFENSSSVLQNIQNNFKYSNIGEHINAKNTIVVSNENSVWVFDKFSQTLRVNKTALTGYWWSKADLTLSVPLVKWQSICAIGDFETKGQLLLLSNSGDLFRSKPNSNHFQSVPLPCGDIHCISSSADALWALSLDGHIYLRFGLNSENPTRSFWRKIDLPEDYDSRLTWISCNCDVIWSCDYHGKIYVAINSPCHMSDVSFRTVLLKVDGQPKQGAQFEKVFVGPNMCMVWAVDDKHNVYVREGIFPHFQTGTNWVFVAGLQATLITISNTSVWALCPNGHLYRRYGITKSNYIGDYWKQIPGKLEYVATSFTDELWGIDYNNTILKLTRKTIILSPKQMSNSGEFPDPPSSNKNDSDWEMPNDLSWL